MKTSKENWIVLHTMNLYGVRGVDSAWEYLNAEIKEGTITREGAQALMEMIRQTNERRYDK